MKKAFFLLVGFLSLGLGFLGVFLPGLPTTPFLLVTAYCFTRSSERLHAWFQKTKLYQKYLASYVKKEGMTRTAKVSLLLSVTLLMGIGFFLMARKGLWIPCAIVALVWLGHLWYFGFRVKTLPPE